MNPDEIQQNDAERANVTPSSTPIVNPEFTAQVLEARIKVLEQERDAIRKAHESCDELLADRSSRIEELKAQIKATEQERDAASELARRNQMDVDGLRKEVAIEEENTNKLLEQLKGSNVKTEELRAALEKDRDLLKRNLSEMSEKRTKAVDALAELILERSFTKQLFAQLKGLVGIYHFAMNRGILDYEVASKAWEELDQEAKDHYTDTAVPAAARSAQPVFCLEHRRVMADGACPKCGKP